MYLLSDAPSLEFLKREAKDLPAAMRETEPGATLTQAQALLAQRYGERSWTALREEVERRRADPPKAPPGLAEALAQAFGLGRVLEPMTPVTFEYMGRRWCVVTDRGRWIAGPVFDYITAAAAEAQAALRERARRVGVSSPVPVRSTEGNLDERVAGSNWRIDEWTELGPRPRNPVRAAHAGRAGEILGSLHALAITTEHGLNAHQSQRPSTEQWQTLLERARRASSPLANDLAGLLPTVRTLSAIDQTAPAAPLILSISDLSPEGVRLGPDDELVVVHWDFAGPQVPEWELGYVLWKWALLPALNIPAARALLRGYADRTGSRPDLTLGTFAVAVTSWLSWTFTQVHRSVEGGDAELDAFSAAEAKEQLRNPLSVERLTELIVATGG